MAVALHVKMIVVVSAKRSVKKLVKMDALFHVIILVKAPVVVIVAALIVALHADGRVRLNVEIAVMIAV